MTNIMKKNSNRQYAQALYEVTKDLSGADLSMALKNFVELLIRDRRFKKADNIIFEFEKYVKKQAGEVEVEIISAKKLDKNIIEKIKVVFGEKVKAIENIDSNILGGIKLKTEDKILDASLKTQLNNLKVNLIN